MFVHAQTGCEVGSAVMCTVAVPDGRHRLQGRVVRVEPLAAAGVGLGIEFDATPEPAPPAGIETPAAAHVTPPATVPREARPKGRRIGYPAFLLQSAAILVGAALASGSIVTGILASSGRSAAVAPHIWPPIHPSVITQTRGPPAHAPRPVADARPGRPLQASLAQPNRAPEIKAEAVAKLRTPTRPHLALKVLPLGTPGPTLTREGRLIGASVPITGSKAEMSHYSLAHPAGIAINFPHATSLLPLGIHVIRRSGFRTIAILERQGGGIQIRFSFTRGPPEIQTLEVDDAAVMLKAVFPEAGQDSQ